jgi:hypothetical protein
MPPTDPERPPATVQSGAEFSTCRTYRYALWRAWGEGDSRVAFIGLNPSTADETEDDPTIRRCIGFAKLWGFDGLVMLNAYAFRATDPNDMKAAVRQGIDAVGPENDETMRQWCDESQSGVQRVVACWGQHCSRYRSDKVKEAIWRPIECLGLTKDGHPKHPLYLKADTKPQPYWSPAR